MQAIDFFRNRIDAMIYHRRELNILTTDFYPNRP